MKPSVQRVYEALLAQGIRPEIREFPESTRTAAEAAAAIGTSVERIVKSLAFAAGEETVLVLASGVNRVDTGKLGEVVGAAIGRADAEQVRRDTGFAIGGVPPLGHARALPVYVDRDLLLYDLVWAAAGTPNAVFPISPEELVRVSGGRVIEIKEEQGR